MTTWTDDELPLIERINGIIEEVGLPAGWRYERIGVIATENGDRSVTVAWHDFWWDENWHLPGVGEVRWQDEDPVTLCDEDGEDARAILVERFGDRSPDGTVEQLAHICHTYVRDRAFEIVSEARHLSVGEIMERWQSEVHVWADEDGFPMRDGSWLTSRMSPELWEKVRDMTDEWERQQMEPGGELRLLLDEALEKSQSQRS